MTQRDVVVHDLRDVLTHLRHDQGQQSAAELVSMQ
jgi:hypothetical protein